MAESRKDLYRRALGHEDTGSEVLSASGGLLAPAQAVYQTVDVTGMGDHTRSQMLVRIAKAFDLPPRLLLGLPPDGDGA